MTTIFGKPQVEVERIGSFESAVFELEASTAGQVLLPTDKAYEEARHIYNLGIDSHPAVIVQAANAQDVASAVRFARGQGLAFSVRSGGHSFAGYGTSDGGLVIDLRLLNNFNIDPEKRTVRAQPGVTSRVLGEAAQEYGLAISTGDTGTVALGGLTLGGGIGWMVRAQGLTIDHLISVEMVTAEGEVVRASAEEHQDMFWALRGGGGNFGVVTEFELQLHPVGPVLGGLIGLPATPEAMRAVIDYSQQAPNELTTFTYLMAAPPAPFVPDEVVGQQIMLLMVCYAGDPSEGEKVVAPLLQVAPPLFALVAPMPYPSIYDFGAEAELPAYFIVRSMFTKEMPDDVIETLIESMALATPQSMIQVRTLGGKFAEVPAAATAFANRDAEFMIAAIGIWAEDESGQSEATWAQAIYEMTSQYSSGVYVNFLHDEPDRIGEAYPEATFKRLAEVKRKYDPENLFSRNVNIKPVE